MHLNKQRGDSSVALRLLRDVVVLFFSIVNQFDRIGVLSPSEGSLSLLISNKGLVFIDVVKLTISESNVVALVSTTPDWS